MITEEMILKKIEDKVIEYKNSNTSVLNAITIISFCNNELEGLAQNGWDDVKIENYFSSIIIITLDKIKIDYQNYIEDIAILIKNKKISDEKVKESLFRKGAEILAYIKMISD